MDSVNQHGRSSDNQHDVTRLAKDARITPAGRFVSESGVNLQGEDVLWLGCAAGRALHPRHENGAVVRGAHLVRSPALVPISTSGQGEASSGTGRLLLDLPR